jgi:hypothetical protein
VLIVALSNFWDEKQSMEFRQCVLPSTHHNEVIPRTKKAPPVLTPSIVEKIRQIRSTYYWVDPVSDIYRLLRAA